MRLFLHLVGWLTVFAMIQLGISDYQRTNWCELPSWLAPHDLWPGSCSRPGVIEVRPL